MLLKLIVLIVYFFMSFEVEVVVITKTSSSDRCSQSRKTRQKVMFVFFVRNVEM